MAFDAHRLDELDYTIDLIQSRFSIDILGKYPNRK
jgi:hypothetical protein